MDNWHKRLHLYRTYIKIRKNKRKKIKMEIRTSKITDLETILMLYESARIFMRENGNPNQWGTSYPPIDLVKEDIQNQHSYVCVDNGTIVGTFYFRKGIETDYNKIEHGTWLNDRPYAVIHRITALKDTKGVASYCLNWCWEQHKNLRIDTHKDNIPMQKTLEKNGFQLCGTIYLKDGSERIAFQKEK